MKGWSQIRERGTVAESADRPPTGCALTRSRLRRNTASLSISLMIFIYNKPVGVPSADANAGWRSITATKPSWYADCCVTHAISVLECSVIRRRSYGQPLLMSKSGKLVNRTQRRCRCSMRYWLSNQQTAVTLTSSGSRTHLGNERLHGKALARVGVRALVERLGDLPVGCDAAPAGEQPIGIHELDR